MNLHSCPRLAPRPSPLRRPLAGSAISRPQPLPARPSRLSSPQGYIGSSRLWKGELLKTRGSSGDRRWRWGKCVPDRPLAVGCSQAVPAQAVPGVELRNPGQLLVQVIFRKCCLCDLPGLVGRLPLDLWDYNCRSQAKYDQTVLSNPS